MTSPSEQKTPLTLYERAQLPTQAQWLLFFDKALLIIGVVALALSLVFFIAYNWLYMGKMGKFILVESGLALSVLGYCVLAYRKQPLFLGQLLLLAASILTGVLLALFGQVYQTGADTWQLFFSWALLITPFVLIARLPALWLLWLALVNVSFLGYTLLNDLFFINSQYNTTGSIIAIFIINTLALMLWMRCVPHVGNRQHWSVYILGLIVAILATYLGLSYKFWNISTTEAAIGFLCWGVWAGLTYWQYRLRHIDLLMLTYFCGSIIILVIVSFAEALFDSTGGALILALLLIGMSAAAVAWLRGLGRLTTDKSLANKGAGK